jgi:hypothetical protein
MNLERFRGRHNSTLQLLQWFQFEHLPGYLQEISKESAGLAERMADALSDGPELSAGLRKLLEAKDCFVRAALSEVGRSGR